MSRDVEGAFVCARQHASSAIGRVLAALGKMNKGTDHLHLDVTDANCISPEKRSGE